MTSHWLIAIGICIAAAALEGLCAGRDPMGKLKALKQPWWSPPAWAWVLIGLAWYVICVVGLVRLLSSWPGEKAHVILLGALMVANAAVNVPTFRMQRLDLAFYFFAPYWLLLAVFLWTACPLDRLTCALFAIYSAYQVYAAIWGWRLWRMNRAGAA